MSTDNTATDTAENTRSRLPNPAALVPEMAEVGVALFKATGNGSVARTTMSLVQLRAGQIVDNAYLTVLHTNNLRRAGVSDERIAAVADWREASDFSAAERVALELVEAVFTANADGERVSDELYARASANYDDKALTTLILAIAQVSFFVPFALIGKPLPGTSPEMQWRQP